MQSWCRGLDAHASGSTRGCVAQLQQLVQSRSKGDWPVPAVSYHFCWHGYCCSSCIVFGSGASIVEVLLTHSLTQLLLAFQVPWTSLSQAAITLHSSHRGAAGVPHSKVLQRRTWKKLLKLQVNLLSLEVSINILLVCFNSRVRSVPS